jgi:HPt (histidine-containing phosphotransfer) domain-containing protein
LMRLPLGSSGITEVSPSGPSTTGRPGNVYLYVEATVTAEGINEKDCCYPMDDGAVAYDMLERSLGKETALEVLSTFVGFAGECIAELRTSVRSNNSGQARAITHELSHSCSVIGAAELLKQCIILEEELQDPDWKRVQACMSSVAAETRAVADQVSKLLS